MDIKVTPGKVDVIALRGTIDALTAPEVVDALTKHIHDGHPNIIVDFSGVDFMSSAGLRAMLTVTKEARAQSGDLRLAAVPATIDKVLKMAGFHNITKIFASVDEALASFG